jgi:hypothetical protein
MLTSIISRPMRPVVLLLLLFLVRHLDFFRLLKDLLLLLLTFRHLCLLFGLELSVVFVVDSEVSILLGLVLGFSLCLLLVLFALNLLVASYIGVLAFLEIITFGAFASYTTVLLLSRLIIVTSASTFYHDYWSVLVLKIKII